MKKINNVNLCTVLVYYVLRKATYSFWKMAIFVLTWQFARFRFMFPGQEGHCPFLVFFDVQYLTGCWDSNRDSATAARCAINELRTSFILFAPGAEFPRYSELFMVLYSIIQLSCPGWYDELARRMAMNGFIVFGHDHRGHGRSEGKRAYIEK